MMKRTILLLILIILCFSALFSCQEEIQKDTASATSDTILSNSEHSEIVSNNSMPNSVDESTVTDESDNDTSVESSDVSDETSDDVSDDSSDDNSSTDDKNLVPEKNIIANPLLFLDTSDYFRDKAYITCAFNKEGIYTTYEFPYNDKHLLDYIEQYGVTVESSIIDTSKTFTFYDKNGKSFDTACGEITCYGEIIIGEVHVCADIQADIPTDSRRFLGTYSGVDIFPEELEYGDNSVTVDLDCDGDNEIIRWTFEKDEEYSSEDNYYYYTLEAVVDGKTVSISDNYDWAPTKRRDFEIFIADVDMDGNYEVIEYVRAASRFNNVFIHEIENDKCELVHYYTLTPEP